jgi:hypothetical protein
MYGTAPAILGFQAVRTRDQTALAVAWINDSVESGATMTHSGLPGHACLSGDLLVLQAIIKDY